MKTERCPNPQCRRPMVQVIVFEETTCYTAYRCLECGTRVAVDFEGGTITTHITKPDGKEAQS